MFHIFLQYILIIPPNTISFQCSVGPLLHLPVSYILLCVGVINNLLSILNARTCGRWLGHELPVAISPKERPSLSQQPLTASCSSSRSGASGPFSIHPGIYTGFILCRSPLLLLTIVTSCPEISISQLSSPSVALAFFLPLFFNVPWARGAGGWCRQLSHSRALSDLGSAHSQVLPTAEGSFSG